MIIPNSRTAAGSSRTVLPILALLHSDHLQIEGQTFALSQHSCSECLQINSLQSIDQNLVKLSNSGAWAWVFFTVFFPLLTTSDEIDTGFSSLDKILGAINYAFS